MWIEYDGETGARSGIVLTDAGMTAREEMGTTSADGHTWGRDGATGVIMRHGAGYSLVNYYRYEEGQPGDARTEVAGESVVKLRAELARFESWLDSGHMSGDYRVNEVVAGLRKAVRHLGYLSGELVDQAKTAALESLRAAFPATCDANVRRGTGTGMCDRTLGADGQCDRAADHI